MVQVKQIQEMGAYVKLVCTQDSTLSHPAGSSSLRCPPDLLQLEYDNIEGMILLSELSRRRIRSIQKLIRVGRNEVVVVMRVDKEKGQLIYQVLLPDRIPCLLFLLSFTRRDADPHLT